MGVVDRDAFSKTIQLIMKTALILGAVAVAFVFAEPEAEPKADADPYLLYGGYTGLHYPTYASSYYTYPAYTYGYGSYLAYGRKKREAESDPKADADPALYYASAYAYPRYSYGYSYPTYSYGYPYYRYGYY